MVLENEKNWKLPKENFAAISEIAQKLNINAKIASVLFNRGIDTFYKMKVFLFGGLETLHNPFLFEDIRIAVERIKKAVDAREKILVYGDRDVDGITAVNIIVNTVKALGGITEWYVPADEGYGIHKDILSKYASDGVKLLITVDCGISAFDEIEYAKTLGMDVILTDHHEPPYEGVPKALAVIDPKTYDSKYPFKDIAGCVVALKTMQALIFSYAKDYDKDILLCHGENNASGFSGEYILVRNGLESEKKYFVSEQELRRIIRDSYRAYFDNKELKDFFVKNDALLNDKITVFDCLGVENVFEAYKVKRFSDDEKLSKFFRDNLDLCALGTIADSMPLTGENRTIVREGLKILDAAPDAKPGLGLLIEDTLTSKNLKTLNARVVSWNITPVLNSSGRMGRGSLSAQFLMTRDLFQAKNLYADIVKLNEDRKGLQSENIERFNTLLTQQCNPKDDKVLIIDASNMEHGVTGIVASQMVKTYLKPAFLLITNGAEATGAARSVEGFDIVAALESVKDILVKYGGHSQAAGFTVEHSKIGEFKRRIYEYADKNFNCSSKKDEIIIESELKISDISADFFKQLEILEPFGMGNVRPVFWIRGLSATEVSVFGVRNEHLRFKVSHKGSKNVQAVFWNNADFANFVRAENLMDIVFNLDVIGKDDKEKVQLNVIDIKSSY
ncbi:single-stranded-DNA-specific exonuclease RecJ [Endomicrobium proavitum]|uniref:Single-stranded-DNA-specific exonuclease RecJ n=1 Tax=Endomicrobium proavitum TaxID=1408281 RepID=A0A0G3WH32_9BACT|nr:single-stranded-DNA-specific exonuclease RecJ [Endomicrobium proavitum]AKL97638.1 putative Single-stranded-DNA-specific exonuclease RecJ [Endomicrobium proavitum]